MQFSHECPVVLDAAYLRIPNKYEKLINLIVNCSIRISMYSLFTDPDCRPHVHFYHLTRNIKFGRDCQFKCHSSIYRKTPITH